MAYLMRGSPLHILPEKVVNTPSPELEYFTSLIWSRPRDEINHLLAHGIPIEHASLIKKINGHNPFLSIIGILPNQLGILAKQTNSDGDKIFEEVSRKL